jgi:hypothetical protein
VEITKLSVKALTDDLIITDDHRTDERIWTDFPPAALSKLESSPQVLSIRGCKRGSHLD